MMRLLDIAAPLLANVAIKSVLVLAFGTMIVFGARRASAAAKHLLWTATLAAALAVPLAVTLLPAIGLPIVPTSADERLAGRDRAASAVKAIAGSTATAPKTSTTTLI